MTPPCGVPHTLSLPPLTRGFPFSIRRLRRAGVKGLEQDALSFAIDLRDRCTAAAVRAGIIRVAWTYSHSNWTAEILNRLYAGTQYQDDFVKRADEATRFKAKEIEKLEDRELESIVAGFFSMTQLASDLWVGISGPAQVRLHDTTPPIGVKVPTTATTIRELAGSE